MTASLQAALTVTSTGSNASGTNSINVTPAGTHFQNTIQSATTSWAVIVLGSISTLGYLFVRNMDATNYVQLTADGATGSKIFCKLLPGQAMLIPVDSGATYGVRANTSACDVLIVACEI